MKYPATAGYFFTLFRTFRSLHHTHDGPLGPFMTHTRDCVWTLVLISQETRQIRANNTGTMSAANVHGLVSDGANNKQ
jgi:hypothetical protein